MFQGSLKILPERAKSQRLRGLYHVDFLRLFNYPLSTRYAFVGVVHWLGLLVGIHQGTAIFAIP